MNLVTPRIRLRFFAADDLDALYDLMANADFMRFSFGPKTRAETQEVLNKFLAWNRAGAPSQFAMIDRQTTRLFGFCGFLHQEVDGAKEIEIGYRLHPSFWNKGLVTEAAREVRNLQLECVVSLIHVDHHASQRVAEKNGMTIAKKTDFKGFPRSFMQSRSRLGENFRVTPDELVG
ncbi:MAG: GNAT family N-acetyltransferase [Verrucomicrobiota bacterium]|nr:GNAT family N-acetyltransferase [Verrucomicrobiota bacterium]